MLKSLSAVKKIHAVTFVIIIISFVQFCKITVYFPWEMLLTTFAILSAVSTKTLIS